MQLTDIPGEGPPWRAFTSRCGHVTGVVTVVEHAVAIYEWQSRTRGRTRAALGELRAQFAVVAAIGIGSCPSDPSWQYWQHMAQSGLVDQLEDDDGHPVTVTAPAPQACAPGSRPARTPQHGMEP